MCSYGCLSLQCDGRGVKHCFQRHDHSARGSSRWFRKRASRRATGMLKLQTPFYRSEMAMTRSSMGDDLNFLTLFSIPGSLAIWLAWWLSKKETGLGAMTKGELIPEKVPDEQQQANGDYLDPENEVEAEAAEYLLGEWVTLPLGQVGAMKGTPVLVPRSRGLEGSLVTVALKRPLGITFEQLENGCIVVSELIQGGNAAKDARLKMLIQEGTYAKAGDILRAATTVQVLYGAAALTGASSPTRTWVPFIVSERSSFADVLEKLQCCRESDGMVTLVLERLP